MAWLLTTLFGATLFALANLCVKLSVTKENPWFLYGAFALSIVAYWLYQRAVVNKGLAIAEGIFGSLITIITIAIGLFIMRETITTKQGFGLALIVANRIQARSAFRPNCAAH